MKEIIAEVQIVQSDYQMDLQEEFAYLPGQHWYSRQGRRTVYVGTGKTESTQKTESMGIWWIRWKINHLSEGNA